MKQTTIARQALIVVLGAAFAFVLPTFAALDSPLCTWNAARVEGGAWWFESLDSWQCQSYTSISGFVPREPAEFPNEKTCVFLGTNAKQSPWVYLQDGDKVTVTGVNCGWGNWSGDNSRLEIRAGAFLKITGNVNQNWEALRFCLESPSHGEFWVNGGVVNASGVSMRGKDGKCTSALRVTNGGVLTNGYFTTGTCPATVEVNGGNWICRESVIVGGVSAATLDIVNGSFCRLSSSATFSANACVTVADSRIETASANWSQSSPPVRIASSDGAKTEISLSNVTWVVYDPAWDKGASGYRWAHWYRTEFSGDGEMAFCQKDSVVTNVGVWFRSGASTGEVAPRYVVDGGELYVHNLNTEKQPIADGLASMGFAAANGAPNAGTLEFLNQAKVSFPGINTNIVVSGNVNALAYEITTNRPHLKFTLTRKGHRPAEIRNQTSVMGLYSFELQGGLQVVSTNRFALLRHKTESSALSTCDESQFRAPNADLWTTGGFADTPCEWGVALRPKAEIAGDADLGDGVVSGYVTLPRCNPETLQRGVLRLTMAPAAKTLAEIVANMNTAGYPATLEGTDKVVVDLKASGRLVKGGSNKVLLDFNAPQNAVAARDGVQTANARVLKATTDFIGSGVVLICR